MNECIIILQEAHRRYVLIENRLNITMREKLERKTTARQ